MALTKNSACLASKTMSSILCYAVNLIRGGFRGGGAPDPSPPPLFLLVKFFQRPIFALLPILASKSVLIDPKCLLCVFVTVKIQFDNTSTCRYLIILVLRSVAMLLSAFGPPLYRNSGSTPAFYSHGFV